MMGHIFISYSHKDTLYVHKLREKLISEGFDAWVDDRIDYGDEWPMIIQEQLDSCDAFILIATESSYKSKWVQKEVTRAQRINKPFFPLLVSGYPWLSIESTQYVDVRDKSLPPEKFYQRLARVSPRRKVPPLPRQPGQKPVSTSPLKPAIKTEQRPDPRPALSNHSNLDKSGSPGETKVDQAGFPSFAKNLAALREALSRQLREVSRKTIASMASIIFIFLLILGWRATQNYKAQMIAEATSGPLATRQAATIRAGLTQIARSHQLTETARPQPLVSTSTANWLTETMSVAFTQIALPYQTATPPTISPIELMQTRISASTRNPATETVAAAFTQIALSYQTATPATISPTTTPTATPKPSNAVLFLDKNYSCKGGPNSESPTRTTMVEGLRLPIVGKSEQDSWWRVRIQAKDLTYDYCWIQGGTVEGDPTSIEVVKP